MPGDVVDRRHRFHATVEVARHPVGRPDVILGVSAVREVRDARVLKKAPNDTDNTNTLAHAAQSGQQTADATHNQVDFHARLRRTVERGNHVRIDQRVHLGNDATTASGLCMRRLTFNELQDSRTQIRRRHDQSPIELLPRHTGERIKQITRIGAKLRMARE